MSNHKLTGGGLVSRKITELKPYENNPRINDKAVDAVAAAAPPGTGRRALDCSYGRQGNGRDNI